MGDLRVLVVGATGMLGSAIVAGLADAGIATRALVRPGRDTTNLDRAGAEVARGDLRDPPSIEAATRGITTVITTANSIGRRLNGERSLDMHAVDDAGNATLIAAAAQAGVERFLFVSLGGPALDARSPFTDAKRRTEARLESSACDRWSFARTRTRRSGSAQRSALTPPTAGP